MLVRPAFAGRLRHSPLLRPKSDRRNIARREATREVVLAAFLVPGHPMLTAAAAARATMVPADVCVRVLGALTDGGFLERHGGGTYSLALQRRAVHRSIR
jgi:hypothetical protein